MQPTPRLRPVPTTDLQSVASLQPTAICKRGLLLLNDPWCDGSPKHHLLARAAHNTFNGTAAAQRCNGKQRRCPPRQSCLPEAVSLTLLAVIWTGSSFTPLLSRFSSSPCRQPAPREYRVRIHRGHGPTSLPRLQAQASILRSVASAPS
jgi:hypothetical protein